MLLYDIIARGGREYPDRSAILTRDQTLTYGQLAEQVDRLAAGLAARGVQPGDSVALLLPNGPEFTIAYYAITALGAVCVPANPLLKPAELEHIWGDSRARLVITVTALIPAAQAALAALASNASLAALGPAADLPPNVLPFGELLASGIIQNPISKIQNPASPAVCIYTSGTTGRPKGALLSHRNLLANCDQIRRALHFDERDNFLCVLPLFHSFAATVCQNTPLYCGARMTNLEQFHPGRVLEAVAQQGVTIFAGVPAMFGALLQWPEADAEAFRSVRICVSGGAPMPVPLMQAFERKFHTIIIEGDGPTECSPVTSVNPPEGVRKPGTIGRPIPGVEMRIHDDADRELPPGKVGEIVVRGDNVMLGYLNQPEATAEAMRGGWYHTGDLGTVDEDGYFTIVDRKKDMLIVGGLNVYPREVEEVLYAHPAVADAAVVGTPDQRRGEEVVAVVVLRPDASATARELIQHTRERLANYKVPRRIVFRDTLPRSSTGKVLKRLLRKEMEMGGEG